MYSKLRFEKTFSVRSLREIRTSLLSTTHKIGASGKLIPRDPAGTREIPWIFINHDIRQRWCYIWNHVCCGLAGMIPSYCRFNCWKTVVKPRNIKELFDCYDIFVKMNLPSKIGADVRKYTFGPWAGFVYAETIEVGREYYKKVRAEIPKAISVILKRGCTEMEAIQPSNLWDKDPGDLYKDRERELLDMFEFQEFSYRQATWLKNEIMESWIQRAIEIGDKTVQKIAIKRSGDKNIWKRLVVNSITYHDKRTSPL